MPSMSVAQEKIDAAVAVVQGLATRVLAGEESLFRTGYVEADRVAFTLEYQEVLVRQEATDYNKREQARKRIIGQAKRLLDEEAGKPDARILRFSSRDHKRVPCLDGRNRSFHGNSVLYTTPELFQRATEAVEAAQAAEQAQREEMTALRERARAAKIPEPSSENEVTVTYGLDAYRALVEQIEHIRSERNYLGQGAVLADEESRQLWERQKKAVHAGADAGGCGLIQAGYVVRAYLRSMQESEVAGD